MIVIACIDGHNDIVTLMFNHKGNINIDLNAKDIHGFTPSLQ